ncbi:MAG: hypothetical protein BGO43_07700 [Gammaproteobacteria bacterium 39-13]|nr:bifunctional acetate--CoA ligase family protein/GNAT family N-acetyltransferase [Gammaproteobacteria bacterium]OJV93051.1 MAG: hypothetical protein BGO43_07700 [Gammaproteobacteria bacterium 39-13]
MSFDNLEHFFNPRTIAVIGASDRYNSIGMRVFKNLIESQYSGLIYPVNLKHNVVQNKIAFSTVEELPASIDLAVIATKADTIPNILNQCAKKGICHVLILSSGFSESGAEGAKLEDQIKDIAFKNDIRILGPNCLGMIIPHLNLNLAATNSAITSGNIGLISQSDAILCSILDWAAERRIGFSALFSLGNAIDLDFGSFLDYLAFDAKTQSILLYIENIHNTRHFMSGLRNAARKKPVILIKTGHKMIDSKIAISNVSMGFDEVVDCAFKRTGVVRVVTIEQLFSAAEILSKKFNIKGDRLAIITNSSGAGIMAADQAFRSGITLTQLTPSTLTRLDEILPQFWLRQNPIDIFSDATPKRYAQAVTACLDDINVDGLLVMLTPVTMVEPEEVAKQIIPIAKSSDKPILVCWLGGKQINSARQLFSLNSIPSFNTPETAIEAFSYLVNYQVNQKLLIQVPEPTSYQSKVDIVGAKMIIDSALEENRKNLTLVESKAILSAFEIPSTLAIEARTANEALSVAESLGFPLVMKINSPDITQKQNIKGVQVNILNAEAVRNTFKEMLNNANQFKPKARILGVTIERMRKEPHDRLLRIGVFRDPTFGPVISFGAGGSLAEAIQTRSFALPPLNHYLAQNLINQATIIKVLGEFHNMPSVNVDILVNILLKTSEMVCELPQIKEMEINPLMLNDQTVVAAGVRIVVDFYSPSIRPYDHMAIHPYPTYLIKHLQLSDGTNITIRPIRPEDAQLIQDFVHQLSAESKHFLFFGNITEFSYPELISLTQLDYDREIALITTLLSDGDEKCIGIIRYVVTNDRKIAEFSIVVADDWQNKGIGSNLLFNILQAAKMQGLKTLQGEVLLSNHKMRRLISNMGFNVRSSDEQDKIIVEKQLV